MITTRINRHEKTIEVYGESIRAYNDNGACFEFILRGFEE
jgi:hypothetical protein